MERKDYLVGLFNGLGNPDGPEMSDYDAGAETCKMICSELNCLGSSAKIIASIYDRCSESGKKNFETTALFALIELAHHRAVMGKTWDLRKQASSEFAYSNRSWIDSMFEARTGGPLLIDGETGFLPRDIKPAYFKAEGRAWMQGFIDKWINEHSTIQQSFIRGVYEAILPVMNPGHVFQPNNDYGGVSFPFI